MNTIMGALRRRGTALCLFCYSPVMSAEAPQNENKTVIEHEALSPKNLTYEFHKEENDNTSLSDAAILFNIPGLSLTDSGGHLAESQIRYRGLSSSRLHIKFEGLRLTDPTRGVHDANSMFLFAAQRIEATSQTLSIFIPPLNEKSARGLFGIGSQNSIKAGASMITPFFKEWGAFLATQVSSTNGEFEYQSPYLKADDPANSRLRTNNDQHRLQTVFKIEKRGTTTGHILGAFNVHQGGIPGYGQAPIKDLRSDNVFAGLSFGAAKTIRKNRFGIDVVNTLFDYRSHDATQSERLLSSAHEINLTAAPADAPSWMKLEFGEHLTIERAYSLNHTRVGGGFSLKRPSKLPGRLKPTMTSVMKIMGYDGIGLLFNKELSLSIDPMESMRVTGRFARGSRLPTFLELYADNQFYMGNPTLDPESIMDFELDMDYLITRGMLLKINGYMGFISNTIVNVPFFANKSRPQNTESARRHGIDLAFTYEPSPWFLLETKNSLLYTKIEETQSPLPHAPPFLGLTKVRFGKEYINLTLQARYRGKSYASVHRSNESKGHALFDTLIAFRPLENLAASLSITNILNLKTAEDTYQMPIPGRVFYAQIEIGRGP